MWQLIDAVRTLAPDIDVRGAFIELADPPVPAALDSIPAGRRIVLVPLLLASGYHDRVDLPRAVAASRPDAVRAAVLGPDPLLAVALADRLVEAGWRPGDAVVLAGAGSSDPDAIASVRTQAALLGAELTTRDRPGTPLTTADRPGTELAAGGRPGTSVTVGFGSAAEPGVPVAVAAARAAGAGRVVVAPYLLAPGYFADTLAAAGADLVAAPLGAHPAIARLILRRATEAARTHAAAQAVATAHLTQTGETTPAAAAAQVAETGEAVPATAAARRTAIDVAVPAAAAAQVTETGEAVPATAASRTEAATEGGTGRN